ncbi:Dph6-related ATP pyrophosphatase [Kaistella jeonii]|uniref:Dph6-related ATP pyrophosphatase n=1 Tax=Kaistella jeonii TaxID=266749 RepID=UPI0008EA065D|nr:ATP-binding protein [Kaistella jeonii]SFB76947.1 MJ0570-related uncharacterized domain-containing protein [Kaistella jeonii]VEI96444.1 MJ0570-related uncharacterized domain [Kaistella jeonii]
MHAVPLAILERQAESIGIPLYKVGSSTALKNYEEKMSEAVQHFKEQGVKHFIFGDIFLSDVKAYRESKLNPVGIEVVEPLWEKTSQEVIDDFLSSGIKSKIIVTQADLLDETYIGKDLDANVIKLFPKGIDLCGENGEYHTLSYAGGLFNKEVAFSIPETLKTSFDFTLDTGEKKTFEYWQAELVS